MHEMNGYHFYLPTILQSCRRNQSDTGNSNTQLFTEYAIEPRVSKGEKMNTRHKKNYQWTAFLSSLNRRHITMFFSCVRCTQPVYVFSHTSVSFVYSKKAATKRHKNYRKKLRAKWISESNTLYSRIEWRGAARAKTFFFILFSFFMPIRRSEVYPCGLWYLCVYFMGVVCLTPIYIEI